MPYNSAADSFHTKKLCSRLSSSEVRFLTAIGRRAFLRPPLGDLGATYDDHLRLVGKRVVDFLLELTEIFCYVLRLRRYERLSVQNRRFCSNGRSRLTQKSSGRMGHQAFFFSVNFSVKFFFSVKLSFVWYKNLDRSFFRFVTIYLCDRQTDRRTDGHTRRYTASALHAAR